MSQLALAGLGKLSANTARRCRRAGPRIHGLDPSSQELAGLAHEERLPAVAPAPLVTDSGEGRWTVAEAIDRNAPAPLIARLRSRDQRSSAERMLAMMGNNSDGPASAKDGGR